MRVDPKQLQAVFLRPESAKTTANPADDFAAVLGAAAGAQGQLPNPALKLDESSAALLSASLLGRLQTERSASGLDVAALTEADLSVPVDQEVGGVLDLLERYAEALGDPQRTLKDIAPLAEDLDQGAARLDRLAATLAEDDPLRSLTNDTAVLAAVESLKFRRGDFV